MPTGSPCPRPWPRCRGRGRHGQARRRARMGADAPVTIPDGFDHDPARLLDQATRLVVAHADYFVAVLGAPTAVDKGPTDCATAVELETERRLSAELAPATGIGVHGEEFGGPHMFSGTVCILDSVDG